MRFLALVALLPCLAPAPLRRGPHPTPAPGAVLASFPEEISAWHGHPDGKHDTLHKASHLVVKGPDGKWVDGTVSVGEKVFFRADRPADLAEGEYGATVWGRWTSGEEEHPFAWSFTLRRAK
ncbi:MAG TPA: hypothetical protein VFI25_20310 [Planctomycetota bacterium]|jgi:hypothetical protein|nr:hypothetical protein [Planctomycetota bacterium]